MRGCEDNCYGRMVIREDDIDGLSFDNDHPLTPAGVDLPENYDLCHRPTDESLNGLFDVTVKAVSFHKDCGPAVVTIAHQEPLQLISSRHELDNGCVETWALFAITSSPVSSRTRTAHPLPSQLHSKIAQCS